jgi:hypothetical protein
LDVARVLIFIHNSNILNLIIISVFDLIEVFVVVFIHCIVDFAALAEENATHHIGIGYPVPARNPHCDDQEQQDRDECD